MCPPCLCIDSSWLYHPSHSFLLSLTGSCHTVILLYFNFTNTSLIEKRHFSSTYLFSVTIITRISLTVRMSVGRHLWMFCFFCANLHYAVHLKLFLGTDCVIIYPQFNATPLFLLLFLLFIYLFYYYSCLKLSYSSFL